MARLTIRFFGGYVYLFRNGGKQAVVGAVKAGQASQPAEYKEHRFLMVLQKGTATGNTLGLGGVVWDFTGYSLSLAGQGTPAMDPHTGLRHQAAVPALATWHKASVVADPAAYFSTQFRLDQGQLNAGPVFKDIVKFRDRHLTHARSQAATNIVTYTWDTSDVVVLELNDARRNTVTLAPDTPGGAIDLMVGDPSDYRYPVDDSPDFRAFYALLPGVPPKERLAPYGWDGLTARFPGEFCIPTQFEE